MRTMPVALKRIGSVSLLLAAIPLIGAASIEAQSRVNTTLSRYNLERYFGDSLRLGTQRVIRPGGAVADLAATATLQHGTFLPTRVAESVFVQPTAPGGDTRVVLPDRAFTETGGGTGMLLMPVVLIEGGGLRYQDGTFRGVIRVGIEDSLQAASSVGLSTPIQFFVSGDVDSIGTPDVAVSHTNLPFAPIALVKGARSPTVSLNVRTTLHREGVDVEVPLLLDELSMDVTPVRVQGFGLEEARLVVGPAPSGAGAIVQLSPDVGHLSDNEVRIGPDGTATAALRSYWVGRSTVTARSVPFEDAQISVEFVFPWIFLAMSLLGGAIGGVASVLQGKKRGARMRRVAQGAVFGLIAAVLYAVGVNVTPINPSVATGQAVVFGLAAVVGYLGTFKLASGPIPEAV